jgi:DNA-binding NarL/FixJ family response regulator
LEGPVTIRVVVADDDKGVRSALCAVLDDDERFTVVGEASDAPEAIVVTALERPDVVLLDVRMPGDGLEAARTIRAANEQVTLIAVTASADAHLIARMLLAGARGVLVKGRLGDLADMIARCHAGEVVLAAPAAAEGLRVYAGLSRYN